MVVEGGRTLCMEAPIGLFVSIINAPSFWQQSIDIANCFLQLLRRKPTNCPEINSAQICACQFGLCKSRIGHDRRRDWWVTFFGVSTSEIGAGQITSVKISVCKVGLKKP